MFDFQRNSFTIVIVIYFPNKTSFNQNFDFILETALENTEKVKFDQNKGRNGVIQAQLSNSETDSAAVVAKLKTMRKGLERKKKMLKEDDPGKEGWDQLN